MREKYESLSLAVLKDLAKARGMKGISTLRKPALIERMLEEDVNRGIPKKYTKIHGRKYWKRKKLSEQSPTGEGLQEQRKEYRSDKNEQEHRNTNIRRGIPVNITGSYKGERECPVRIHPAGQWRKGCRMDYGFIRCENYLPGENDIYVSPSQIRRFNLKTGDIIQGNIRIKTQGEKFSALLYVTSINGFHPSEGQRRYNFEDMTPIFPDERLRHGASGRYNSHAYRGSDQSYRKGTARHDRFSA